MKKIILYIDTSDSVVTKIAIIRDQERKEYLEKTDQKKSQNLLPLIEMSFRKEKLELKDLTEIQVDTGPGSFTGIRVGIAIANTLGWILKIPVNGSDVAKAAYQASKFDLTI